MPDGTAPVSTKFCHVNVRLDTLVATSPPFTSTSLPPKKTGGDASYMMESLPALPMLPTSSSAQTYSVCVPSERLNSSMAVLFPAVKLLSSFPSSLTYEK